MKNQSMVKRAALWAGSVAACCAFWGGAPACAEEPQALNAEVTLNFKQSKGTINPLIYGHFAEHIGGVFRDGLWVGENSKVENIRGFRKALVESFKKINPSNVRWPGGCFAETYNWRDGIGPREKRPVRAGWWLTFDNRTEPNEVGTHEFIDFCRMVGAEPYIAANMTSLCPQDIRDWVEYCNVSNKTTLALEREANGSPKPFNVKFWGIGNENWGGGGCMTPEMCMREYRRYTTICENIDRKKMNFIFCGANGYDLEWTRRIMKEWKDGGYVPVWAMSVHYYCRAPGTPQGFTEDEWYIQMFKADFMRRIIDDHRHAMDKYDPQRNMKLAIDEWGSWLPEGTGPSKGFNLFEQQSSMRDAMVTALTFNILNSRCDIVKMANVAQLCNNLHCLYLAGGEHFVETPTYHVFDMYKTHQGGRQIETSVSCASVESTFYKDVKHHERLGLVSASASEKDGKLTVTLANLHMTKAQRVTLNMLGGEYKGKAQMMVLSHKDPHTCNTFENPKAVVPVCREVASVGVVEIPPAGIVSIIIEK